MAYVGNNLTVQQYAPQIAYFSGNASTTAFTLPQAVVSSAQILVFVANVPQNPSSAYTVSGTTLTFTSAPPTGTNNVWVEYTSLQTNTVVPSYGTVGPSQINSAYSLWNLSGSDINYTAGNVGIGTVSPATTLDVQAALAGTQVVATTGTNRVFQRVVNTSGNFYFAIDSSTGGLFGGAAYARTLYGDGAYPMSFFTNATERMRIDSSGRVTTPYQPAFFVFPSASSTATTIPFNTAVFNIGSYFNTSTYTFTAPVAGIYWFNLILAYDTGTVPTLVTLYRNGGRERDMFEANTWNVNTEYHSSTIIYLNTNDTVFAYNNGNGNIQGGALSGQYYSAFQGYLIG
jgi:hypothetical protein